MSRKTERPRKLQLHEIDLLKHVLGGTYGGPSLSVDPDSKEFVLYSWTDAPVGMHDHARNEDWDTFMLLVDQWRKDNVFEECFECGKATKDFHAEHQDPREPPCEEGKVLCKSCVRTALEERIDEMESELNVYQKELDGLIQGRPELGKPKKKKVKGKEKKRGKSK